MIMSIDEAGTLFPVMPPVTKTRVKALRMTDEEWMLIATKLAVVIPELYDKLAKTPMKNYQRASAHCNNLGGDALVLMMGRMPGQHTVPEYAFHQLHVACRRVQGYTVKYKGPARGYEEARVATIEVSEGLPA